MASFIDLLDVSVQEARRQRSHQQDHHHSLSELQTPVSVPIGEVSSPAILMDQQDAIVEQTLLAEWHRMGMLWHRLASKRKSVIMRIEYLISQCELIGQQPHVLRSHPCMPQPAETAAYIQHNTDLVTKLSETLTPLQRTTVNMRLFMRHLAAGLRNNVIPQDVRWRSLVEAKVKAALDAAEDTIRRSTGHSRDSRSLGGLR